MKIAVVFPGIGYHADKPLLYYSKRLAGSYGYEIVEVPYGNFPPDVKGSKEKMEASFYQALYQAENLLKEVNFSKYKEILFISKSVGTAAAAAFGQKYHLQTRNLYFTPIGISFQFMDQPGIVFHGTSDRWVETALVKTECARRALPLRIFEGANHSLETGDVRQDLRNLQKIMEEVDEYLRE